MTPAIWLTLVLAAIVGHFGLHVAIYNRVNGFGFKRKTVKRVEHFFLMTMMLIPFVVVWLFGGVIAEVCSGQATTVPFILGAYGIVCLVVWLVLGIPWLLWRPMWKLEWIDAPREIKVVNVQHAVNRPLALSSKCKVECKLPMNQIFDLSIDQISLPVMGLPAALDGYRIAHFSDIHLTGHIHGDFTKYVVQRATDWQPDLMAVTGDIIDKPACIDWLQDIFSPAAAPDGCYFILGNHDKLVADPNQTRDAMAAAGWTGVGQSPIRRRLRDVDSMVIGNEAPWFPRPELTDSDDVQFRLLLSHSPDQLSWARKQDVHLMLVGHTHGGQGRLPVLGPVLSPSFHGSRYASGDFYKSPTTMHVSRGLSGTHLLRINCRPQLSLLTLKATK